jgi:hypothetical protein
MEISNVGFYRCLITTPALGFYPTVIRVNHKVTLSSPLCLWASFHPHYPLFLLRYLQSRRLFNKSQYEMVSSYWYSAFNAQGSRLIIVVVQLVVAVKIYVAAAVEALRKKERQDETIDIKPH